jgi:hypothetical protein
MKYLISSIFTFIFSTAYAQQVTTSSNFLFKISKATVEKDSIYNINITDDNFFKISIDTAGLSIDSIAITKSSLVFEKDKFANNAIENWNKTYSLKVGEKLYYIFNGYKVKAKGELNKAAAKVTLDTSYIKFALKVERKAPTASFEETAIATVKKTVQELFNEQTDSKNVGVFSLTQAKDRKVNVCFKRKKEEAIYIIDSVSIYFDKGVIVKRGLFVKVHKEGDNDNILTFRNMGAAISLAKIDRAFDYKLTLSNNIYDPTSLTLGQVIGYEAIGDFQYPDGGLVTLTGNSPNKTISNVVTLKDMINMSIFTDLLALVGKKPNGVLQAELDAHFITNTVSQSFKHRLSEREEKKCEDEGKKSEPKDRTIFAFVNPYFNLAKFDSKFQQFDLKKGVDTVIAGKRTIDRLYANQIAYLRAGTRVNVYTRNLYPNEQVQFNIGAELALTNADSLIGKDLVSVMYYPEYVYKVNRMSNFGFEASLRCLFQFTSKNNTIENNKPKTFLNPQVVLYYYPFSNPESRIYLRYAHFAELSKKDKNSNYPQIQFGYKTNLFKQPK